MIFVSSSSWYAQSIQARCYVENEDIVGAVRIGDAPTTSDCSKIVLRVCLILEVWLYTLSGDGLANILRVHKTIYCHFGWKAMNSLIWIYSMCTSIYREIIGSRNDLAPVLPLVAFEAK